MVGIAIDRLIRSRIALIALDEGTWTFVFMRSLRGVTISFFLVMGLFWAIDTVNISPTLTQLLSYLLFTSIIFSITRVIARTVDGVITMYFERSAEKLPKTTLLNTILTGFIYAMGLLVVLQHYGISIAPILTAAGVGGMAVALSLQETLTNIFSGLHLILSKQVRIGDYIRLSSGEEGRVTDITWRFTTIVPVGASNTVVIPNKTLAGANITNFSLPASSIKVTIPVGVAYDSDLEQVERVTLEVAREISQSVDHRVTTPPVIRFHTFGDSSIDFDVIIESSQFDNQGKLKHEFIKVLTARYRVEGIDIPFPVRTIIDAGNAADETSPSTLTEATAADEK